MTNTSNMCKSTLAWGIGLSSLHFFWILLVAAGWAQSVIDFIFKIHMLSSPFQIQPFSFLFSVQLLLITFLIGMVFGSFIQFIKRF